MVTRWPEINWLGDRAAILQRKHGFVRLGLSRRDARQVSGCESNGIQGEQRRSHLCDLNLSGMDEVREESFGRNRDGRPAGARARGKQKIDLLWRNVEERSRSHVARGIANTHRVTPVEPGWGSQPPGHSTVLVSQSITPFLRLFFALKMSRPVGQG